MAGKLNNYKIGQGGVNLTKDPLHLSDDELQSCQNAEIVETGSDGAISKRGGLAVLNAALAGSILGIHSRPILTTYTRTLYVSKGTEDATTWMTSTNGTSWVDSSSPLRHAAVADFTDENNTRDARRMTTYKGFLVYPGNNYTKNTDNPEISIWDGTTASLVSRINISPAGNQAPPYAITDMITANGKIYMAVHDPGGTGANIAGRVLQYDLFTGKITQVLNAFGPGTGEMTGGAPSALCWYQEQLWVGLNGSATTDGIGKVVKGRPDIDTIWTSDVATLRSHISTLAVFKGDLYAGTQSSVSAGATITKRAATGTTWATQVTSASGAAGNGHYASMIVDAAGTTAYAVEYYSGATDVVHILSSTDGTTWSTSRDVDALDGVADPPQLPGQALELSSAIYYSFRATSTAATDGFIMRLSGGTWTKIVTDNLIGQIGVLVTRV